LDEDGLANVNRATVRGRVSRNGSGAALQVNLASSDTTELRLPSRVMIAAGQTSAEFVLTPVDDLVLDGPQNVTISASAAGYTQRPATIVTVRDNEVAALSVAITPARIAENGVMMVVVKNNVEITRNTKALRVSLGALPLRQINLPASVTIPAGHNSTSLRVPALDNRLAEGPRVVTITARATGFAAGLASLVLTDNEAASNLAIRGRITTGSLPVSAVTVTLNAGATVLSRVVSSANGDYVFSGVPRGAYRIVAVKSGVVFMPRTRTVVLSTAGVSAMDFLTTLRP
jgi:hypothetical protein